MIDKPKTAALAAAMAKAFAEIEAATKDKTNPHFKSKYADITSVIEAVKPALVKHGLFFTQVSHVAEDGVCVETVIHHEGGESLSCGQLYVPANKRDAQGFGSALTYCRRYALMTAFGVPAEDDDGNAAAKSSEARRERPFTPGPARNKTDLKEKATAFWADTRDCDDMAQFHTLQKDNAALVNQIATELPDWWNGGNRPNGEEYEGLGALIARRLREFAAEADERELQEERQPPPRKGEEGFLPGVDPE